MHRTASQIEQIHLRGIEIANQRIELFRGGHLFFLFAERQQFLDQAGRFLAG